VPTAIKVYNWVLTLWRGNIHLRVPMLFAIGFVFTFINGGLTGLFLGNVTIDLPLSDTYFVVAHFHMVMAVSPILVVFGAIYHWYPKITGKMLDDTLGRIHFWMTFLGTYAIYYPMHYLGFEGLPRRYFAYGDTGFISESSQDLNAAITIAAIIVALSQLIFIYNLIVSYFRGKDAGSNPWGATTLEWQTADTPPKHGNFGEELPSVYRWAYDYSVPGAPEDFIPQNVSPSEVAALSKADAESTGQKQ
jgi:cytochrome c oxidase subunit 1